MTDSFTGEEFDYTMNIDLFTGEEEELTSKYHNEYSIYLYCTMERDVARDIMDSGFYKAPLTLYETPAISKIMSKNLQNPVTLRIAVNLGICDKEWYYDQLTMEDASIKRNNQVKNIEEYKEKCVYTRCLVTEPKTKVKIIEYRVLDSRRYINPQYV